MSKIASIICEKVLGFCGIPTLNLPIEYYGGRVNHKLYTPIDEVIAGIYGAQGYLLSDIWSHSKGNQQQVKVNIPHSLLSISSPILLKANNYPVYPYDPQYPTMGLYPDKNGTYIYLHGGYPHLRDIILKILDVPNDKERIAAKVAQMDALEIEEQIAAVEGCAAVVRAPEDWLKHPQGALLEHFPPIFSNFLAASEPKPLPQGERPLSGLRVLDWTHVIAAPVCARSLAEHGADVLHISAPHLPQIPSFAIDTAHGKRQAYLDVRNPVDKEKMWELLRGADVFLTGWTPGKMGGFGFSPIEVAAKVPGIIIVTLSCYGVGGPWKTRPGWEQLGQTVSGLLSEHSKHYDHMTDLVHTHGIFPCDFITGLLANTGVLSALIKRHYVGGSYHVHISLTRSGMWLHELSQLQSDLEPTVSYPLEPEIFNSFLETTRGPWGNLTYVKPVLELSETNPYFSIPARPLGSDEPVWL